MIKKMILPFLLCLSVNSFADYNANMEGVLKTLAVYADGDYIYIQLENQPSSHPTCNATFFVVTAGVTESRRQFIMSRLSMAFATKEMVNIGYDAQGDCADGYIRLHRVG